MSKYELEKINFTNHPIPMIGRVWVFPNVTYTKDAEGELGISLEELERLQLSVANAICGEDSPLISEEFDFLCAITHTAPQEISEILKCHVTNISKWRQKNQVPHLESLVLKETFWFKIFGNKIESPKVIFGKLRLESMAKSAIEHHLVNPASKKVA